MKSKLFLIVLIALSAFSCGKFSSTESSQDNNANASVNQTPSESITIYVTINKGSKIKAEFLSDGKSEYSTELDSENQLPEFYAKFKDRLTASGNSLIIVSSDSDIDFKQSTELIGQALKSGAKTLGFRQSGRKEVKTYDLDKPQTDEPQEAIKVEGDAKNLVLIVSLDKKGNLTLDNEKMGTVEDTSQLETRLARVFEKRKSERVFREGTDEVEKTTFIRFPAKISAFDPNISKLIEAVKRSGASPIGLLIDD